MYIFKSRQYIFCKYIYIYIIKKKCEQLDHGKERLMTQDEMTTQQSSKNSFLSSPPLVSNLQAFSTSLLDELIPRVHASCSLQPVSWKTYFPPSLFLLATCAWSKPDAGRPEPLQRDAPGSQGILRWGGLRVGPQTTQTFKSHLRAIKSNQELSLQPASQPAQDSKKVHGGLLHFALLQKVQK